MPNVDCYGRGDGDVVVFTVCAVAVFFVAVCLVYVCRSVTVFVLMSIIFYVFIIFCLYSLYIYVCCNFIFMYVLNRYEACFFPRENPSSHADAEVTITFSRRNFCVKLCFLLTLMWFYFNVSQLSAVNLYVYCRLKGLCLLCSSFCLIVNVFFLAVAVFVVCRFVYFVVVFCYVHGLLEYPERETLVYREISLCMKNMIWGHFRGPKFGSWGHSYIPL